MDKNTLLTIIWLSGAITAICTLLMPFIISKFKIVTKYSLQESYLKKEEVEKLLCSYMTKDMCNINQDILRKDLRIQHDMISEMKQDIREIRDVVIKQFKKGD